MEILKGLDFVEILKTGAIGLGFLLALLSFILLRKEQTKNIPSKVILASIVTFMIFSLLIMAMGVLSFVFDSSTTLSLKLGGNELKVSEIKSVKSSEIDLEEFYASSKHEFAFKLPNENWSPIINHSGTNGLFKLMGIKSRFITEESIKLGISRLPIGPLFEEADMFYFENPETKIFVSPSDSVSNEEIELAVSTYSKKITDTTSWLSYDTTDVHERIEYEEDLIEYRKDIVLFDTLEVKESFLLYALPKKSLFLGHKKLKLPALFVHLTSIFGLNTDKLVADQNQILIGIETEIKNLLNNGSSLDVKVKKWILVTENENYFYVIEITFPQRYETSVERWDELQETLNSFVKLM